FIRQRLENRCSSLLALGLFGISRARARREFRLEFAGPSARKPRQASSRIGLGIRRTRRVVHPETDRSNASAYKPCALGVHDTPPVRAVRCRGCSACLRGAEPRRGFVAPSRILPARTDG